jgi:hypothetical protein
MDLINTNAAPAGGGTETEAEERNEERTDKLGLKLGLQFVSSIYREEQNDYLGSDDPVNSRTVLAMLSGARPWKRRCEEREAREEGRMCAKGKRQYRVYRGRGWRRRKSGRFGGRARFGA